MKHVTVEKRGEYILDLLIVLMYTGVLHTQNGKNSAKGRSAETIMSTTTGMVVSTGRYKG